MLEGLEVSEIKYSEIIKFVDKRIDAEFFDKSYLKINSLLTDFHLLSEISETYELHSNGAFKDVYNFLHNETSSDVRYIRSENVGDFFVSGNFDYISNYAHKNLPKTKTELGDILTARTGKVGGASIITNEFVNCNSNQNVVNIRIKDKDFYSPYFVTTFLNSYFGIKQFEKSSTGNVQPWLNLSLLRQVKIPKLSITFQSKIENLIKKSYDIILNSQQTYAQAEKLLLEAVGLQNFTPSKEAVNIKSFKESFLQSGRLDAEYYQPKYDEIENILLKCKNYRIKEIKIFNARGLQPIYNNDGTLDVINSKHILDDNLDYDNFEKTNMENWELQERARVYKNDILTYTTGANIGRTQTYLVDSPAIASNHVNILRLKKINPIYAGFVMNSVIGRLQTEKYCAGSAQSELYPKDIDEFIIPVIDDKPQQTIAQKIQQSFALQKQSKELLEAAKKAVEIAIEEGEEKAMGYLNEL